MYYPHGVQVCKAVGHLREEIVTYYYLLLLIIIYYYLSLLIIIYYYLSLLITTYYYSSLFIIIFIIIIYLSGRAETDVKGMRQQSLSAPAHGCCSLGRAKRWVA